VSFKTATWTAAEKVVDENRTKGAPKNLQLKETYFVIDALKQLSGCKWDEENGTDINSDTLPVWNAYVEVCALSTLHYFTHHNIYPEVPKGCMLQNKGLAILLQHANDDTFISTYKGCECVPSSLGQPREQ
jgi:hypothetical protein